MIARKLAASLELESNPHKRFQEDDLVSLVYIEDNDPRVQYTKYWNVSRNTSRTTVSGSQCSLKFNGTLITVYGVVPENGNKTQFPSASYSIDGTLIAHYAQNYSTNQGSHPFFTSNQLAPSREHTLTINVTDAARGYVLDFFAVTPMETPPPPLPPPPVNSSASNSLMIGAVAGTVAGSIVLLIIAFVIWFKYLRERPPNNPRPLPPGVGYTSSRNSSRQGTMFTSSASILDIHSPSSLKMDRLSTRSEQTDDLPKTPVSGSDLSTLRFAYDVP